MLRQFSRLKKTVSYMKMVNLEIGRLRHKGAVTCRRPSVTLLSAFTSDWCPAVTVSEIGHLEHFWGRKQTRRPTFWKKLLTMPS